jgi:hypothetical protein
MIINMGDMGDMRVTLKDDIVMGKNKEICKNERTLGRDN